MVGSSAERSLVLMAAMWGLGYRIERWYDSSDE